MAAIGTTTKTSTMNKIGLTGSRYFKNAVSHDTDLFAPDSDELRRQLIAVGFIPKKITGRGGPNANTLFRKGDHKSGNQIDIMLVTNVEMKKFEQRLLSVSPFKALMGMLPKKGRNALWSAVQGVTHNVPQRLRK